MLLLRIKRPPNYFNQCDLHTLSVRGFAYACWIQIQAWFGGSEILASLTFTIWLVHLAPSAVHNELLLRPVNALFLAAELKRNTAEKNYYKK